MRMSKNIIAITFALLIVSCSYSSLRPEVVDRADAQRMQTVIFATVVSIAIFGKKILLYGAIFDDKIQSQSLFLLSYKIQFLLQFFWYFKES